MNSILVVSGLFLNLFLLIGLVVHLSSKASKSQQSIEELKENLDAARKFQVEMARSKKSGQDLVNSLLGRSRRGMREEDHR